MSFTGCHHTSRLQSKMNGAATTSLFYGFTGSSDYLKSSHKNIPLEEPTRLSVRSHRKSRKLLRFMKRKAFLQKHGLLATQNLQPVEEDLCFVPNKDHSCRLQFDEQNTNDPGDPSVKIAELKAMLNFLPPVASSPPSTSCDDDSGLSMSSSSPPSRLPSPIPLEKPGSCVAIDCEMVGTGPAGRISELARCSIVDYGGNVLYDKYIKSELPVTDYRTRWSGVTARHLKNAISYKTARKEILNILKGKRVIGHALHNDFKVLKYYHRKGQIIDTSKTPLLNKMAELPKRPSPSLKTLARCLLHKTIQVGKKGHSSVEDAQTCMELYKLVEDRLEQDSLSGPEEESLSNSHYMEDQYWPSDLDDDTKSY